ncbi:MAG TPA: zf-HC2 domain-containing protein [Pyrinomonadaceae bacterium]
MRQHLSIEAINQYCRRSMSAAQLLSAGDHLAICEACRRQVMDVLGAPNIYSSLRARLRLEAASNADHLSYEQIAGFVDGKLDDADRELVETHLEHCALCADEATDLRSLHLTITTTPVTPIATQTSGLRERLRNFWGTWSSWTPHFATAPAIVLLLVFVTGALILVWKMRSRSTDLTANRGSTEVTSVPSPIPTQTTTPASGENVEDENLNIQLALNDAGGRITVDKQGNIAGLDALSPPLKSVVSQALKTERVEPSRDLAELSGKTGTLLGNQDQSAALVLLSPVGRVLRADRPRFRWRPLAGASSYTVNILDSDFNVLQTSPPLTVTSWTPSSSLARGKVLSWQVTAVKDGQTLIFPTAPAPEVRFKILESEKARELTRAEGIKPRSHLALGVLYARTGLLDDAERELRALAAANPQSDTARKLLRSIQAAKNQRTKRK